MSLSLLGQSTSDLELLRDKILHLRLRTAEPRVSFVPAGALNRVLTPETIREAIQASNLPVHRHSELVGQLTRGGRRLFAILLVIHKSSRLLHFIESDELQNIGLDSRLPMSLSTLENILCFKNDAAEFFEKQWEFTAPIFKRRAGHRFLNGQTVFPFLRSEIKGTGGYSNVYQVVLHPDHARSLGTSDNQGVSLMRKELKAATKTEDFDRECRVLSFLNCIEHPNIVELLGSYTYNGLHNLLMPVAHRDLYDFMQIPNHTQFTSEADFLLALCGLSSAIQELHNYYSRDLNVQMIGYHHDLKPRNVLVQDANFLLADFGLSNFKQTSEDSQTPFTTGDGRYLAPECDLSTNSTAPVKTGRARDIWSFGCIIAELITYMILGPDGVEQFEGRRRFQFANQVFLTTFHTGSHVNEGVLTWLAELQRIASPVISDFIQLIRSMLEVDPGARPVSSSVTARLRILALKSKYRAASEIYDALASQEKELEITIEQKRFHLWGKAVRLEEAETSVGQESGDFADKNFFQDSVCYLTKLLGLLDEANQRYRPSTVVYSMTLQLRKINDEMGSWLSRESQVAIDYRLEQEMVMTEDLDLLQDIKATFGPTSHYRGIGTLAAVKYMHRLCDAPPAGCGSAMRLKSWSFSQSSIFEHFVTGNLVANGIDPGQYVIVEKIKYESHWVGTVGDELYNRVGAISELLRVSSQNGNKMRVLSPMGYYHNAKHREFCLVFRIPGALMTQAEHGAPPTIFTLQDYIRHTEKDIRKSPSLELRSLLATQIAAAIAEVHKAGWLHKNISSFVIILTKKDEELSAGDTPEPYLVGFNYARPNKYDSFSNKENRVDILDYRHPEYLKSPDTVRFQPRFDVFSLGMVLLEIGLWRTLKSMTRKAGQGLSPEKLTIHLIQERVPQLAFFMGESYRDIVLDCLNGHQSADLSRLHGAESEPTSEFAQIVSERLSKCISMTTPCA